MLPPCCCTCVVALDMFDDAGSLGSPWTVVGGTWSVSSGQATVASPSVRDHAYMTAAGGSTYHGVDAVLAGENDGDELGLVYVKNTTSGDLSYVILKVDSTDAIVTLYKYVVSTATETAFPSAHVVAAAGVDHRLRVCVNSGSVFVYLNDTLVLAVSSGSPMVSGTQVAGMIARTSTGDPTWNWVAFSKSDTTKCACLPCTRQDTLDEFNYWNPLWAEYVGNFDVDGGRLVDDTGTTGGVVRKTGRCAMLPPDLDDVDFSISADVFWDAAEISGGVQPVAGVFISGNGSLGQTNIEFTAMPVAFFGASGTGWAYKINDAGVTGSFITGGGTYVYGTPVVGDNLEIRVTDTSDGAGTYTVRFYVNGVLKATETGVALSLDDSKSFIYGAMKQNGSSAYDATVEWDDFFYNAQF